ncbi:MAG: riboflavin synthase, partial [Kiritimatiellaeota bacterium]|nr:riboflavin synthase [Kiritimatiellota bacterium]
LRIACDDALLRYIIHKGSIAIDGVSLTVTAVTTDAFEVNLIPTTLSDTTLGACAVNAAVNLETDLVAKYIAQFMRHADRTPVSLETLTAAGFL